jgi:hypothetical protein
VFDLCFVIPSSFVIRLPRRSPAKAGASSFFCPRTSDICLPRRSIGERGSPVLRSLLAAPQSDLRLDKGGSSDCSPVRLLGQHTPARNAVLPLIVSETDWFRASIHRCDKQLPIRLRIVIR